MVSTNYTATKVTSQTPPIVAELQQVFANLDDSRLINELEGSTRRGPKGYPARTLWQAILITSLWPQNLTLVMLEPARPYSKT